MNNLKNLTQCYESQKWNESLESIFDDLKRQDNKDFFDFLLRVISEGKTEKFVEESLRSLKFLHKFFENQNDKKTLILLIQKLATDDNISPAIREQAITELGNLGEWPDLALRSVIESNDAKYLKIFAFKAILTQLHLPEQVIRTEFRRVLHDEIEPNFHEINRITQARADGQFDHLNS
jgi:hypothetical protein